MAITISECSIFDSKIAAEWEGIYKTNAQLTVFSSYSFTSLFIKKFSKEKSRRSLKPVLIRAFDDKRGTLMFLPLCKRHDNYYTLYDYSSVPYCDAVYRTDITKDDFDYIMDHLCDVLGNNTVYFTKMSKFSEFTKYLYERYTAYKKRRCGSIELLRSYDYTYKLIDKECRENIEEAQEKIRTQGLQYKTDFYLEKPLSKRVLSDILLITGREETGLLKRMRRLSAFKNSAVLQSIRNGNDSLVAVSYIDDYPVACIYGFIRNKKIIVVKLASTKYGVGYSSIHLLLSDLIKYSVDNKLASSIDLCRTDDKIKSDFVSKKHHVYSFEIKL